jgi:hypothetical protein
MSDDRVQCQPQAIENCSMSKPTQLNEHAPRTPNQEALNGRADKPEIMGFRVKQEIGEGGMGVVWLATQDSPSRDVAIKVMKGQGAGATERGRQEPNLTAATPARCWTRCAAPPRGSTSWRKRCGTLLRASTSALSMRMAR